MIKACITVLMFASLFASAASMASPIAAAFMGLFVGFCGGYILWAWMADKGWTIYEKRGKP